jgi:ATP-dependent DNA ligase
MDHCLTPYSKRFSTLQAIVDKQKSAGKKIWTVTSTIVQTLDEAQEIFQGYLADGYEGIILKDGSW